MCSWVGPHAASFGSQLWGLTSHVEYLSPQGVLLLLVYGTTASLLWLELQGLSAWQATTSWTVYRLACHQLPPWLQITFAMVPDAVLPGLDQWSWGTAPVAGPVGRLGRPSAPDRWGVSFLPSLGRPTCAPVCGVPGHLALVHRCGCSMRCVASPVYWASWLLFTSMLARCLALRVPCGGPPGSSSPVCTLSVLWRAFAVWATWLLFASVPACFVVWLLRSPGPLGSYSPLCPLGVLCRACSVPGHLAPVHRCARAVCCVACAVSSADCLLFTGVLALCFVLVVRCPVPLASCSPVCPLALSCCLGGVRGHLALVHRCARSVCCLARAVSGATWLLLTGVSVRCVVLLVQCPGPLSFCSLVCPLCVLCCVYRVLGHLAPIQRCACWVCCVVSAVSLATWLLFTSMLARCVALCVWCPGPLGSCSPVCPLGALCCVRGVLGQFAPVHQYARSVCCVACAVFWATWLLFTGVHTQCVLLRVRCPEPLGSCFLVHGGCPPACITQKRPNHGQGSVHGEPKCIEGQQPYVQ